MATITSPGPRRCLFFTFFGRLMSSWKSKTVPPQEVVKVSWNNRNKSLENTWAHLPFRIINLPSSPVLSPKKQWYTQKFKMIQSSDQNVIDRYGHCPVWTIQKCQKGRTEQLILLLSLSQTQAPFPPWGHCRYQSWAAENQAMSSSPLSQGFVFTATEVQFRKFQTWLSRLWWVNCWWITHKWGLY